MRNTLIPVLALASLLTAQETAAGASQSAESTPARPVESSASVVSVQNLLEVRRVYVAKLTGSSAADSMRELIIASLNATRLFVLTEDQDRADAVLKGAADDRSFVNTFDVDRSAGGHTNGGTYANKSSSRLGGYLGQSADERESHHSRELKHEAFATVRLCSRGGDVLWSTTQESAGSKFKGAGADVASKVARQILADYEAQRSSSAR